MAWQRDVFRFVSQRTRIVSGAVRSIVWLVVLGLGLRRSFVPIHGLSYEQFLFPGIIAMAVIFSAIQSAISMIWDREFGFLREVLWRPSRAARSSSARRSVAPPPPAPRR